MNKSIIACAVCAALSLAGCNNNEESKAMPVEESVNKSEQASDNVVNKEGNVLLRVSQLQYEAPEFDKIKVEDFEPAFEKGFKAHKDEIVAIIENTEAPTFENTIIAMEKSGALLSRVARTFNALSGLVSNEDYQRIESNITPKMAAHYDNIYLNSKLFAKIEKIYAEKEKFGPVEQRLIENYYNRFVRAGAKLNDKQKQRMREINSQLSKLATDYSQNILKSFKNDTILVANKNELEGLTDAEIESLAAAAKNSGKSGYLITLVNTTRQPILSRLKNRELRKRIWQTSAGRAMEANAPIIKSMVTLRAEKAQMLGYQDWASYVTADQMAQNPKNVFDMLDDLAPRAVAKARSEAEAIKAEMKSSGADYELQPWDWAFYAEKVRAKKFDIDESLVKPYFEFNRVLNDGLFYAMNKLYGITLKPRTDLPVWEDSVKAWEVFDEDGTSIGLFYLDLYAREGKAGGAWMDELVTQSELLNQKPVVYNALNVPKPAEGQPTLMTFDEVSTLFHEFGHAIHGLFSKVKYPSLAGTSTARDFVEFPSQANEDWSIEPEVLANYAKHYQTGEPIPKDLLDKVLKSRTFNQGFDTTEYLAAAILDMEWHSIKPDTQIDDVALFEREALAKHGIDFAPVPPRYKSNYFSHIFSGGYSAGYYAYIWTEVFAADSFAYMKANGGLTRKNGDNYRKHVLSMGNSQDLMQDYINFRGQKPTIDALLKRRGLVD
jgi:peptidyl-dipeptidase Dcp